jgi:hypothetical protein
MWRENNWTVEAQACLMQIMDGLEAGVVETFSGVSQKGGILLANLLQRSRSTFSWGSFPSFFAFKEGT